MKQSLLSTLLIFFFSFISFISLPLFAQLNVTSCPLTTELPCGELIYNGDFDQASEVPSIGSWSHFGADIVCNWIDGSGSSDLIFRNSTSAANLNQGALLNDPYARIASSLNPTITESFATLLAGPVKTGDKLVLSAEVRMYASTGRAEEVKFWLVNYSDLLNVASPKDLNIYNISPKQEIGLVEGYQINFGSFTQFDFCAVADGSYDCLLVLAKDLPNSTGSTSGQTAIDNISLVNLNAFDNPDDFIVSQCMANEPLLDDCQDVPALNYNWSPTTGLSNPDDLYTTVDVNNPRSSYVLRISHPTIFCETYTRVNTIIPPTLEDGKDISWGGNIIDEIIPFGGGFISNNATFIVEGDFLVDKDWTLTNCILKMMDGAKIRVTNGATLTFNGTAGSFIESCGQGTEWDGIYVEGPSTLNINHAHPFKGSENGITLSNGAQLTADYVDFEDNLRCIYSSNTNAAISLGLTVNHCSFKSKVFQQGSFPSFSFYYPQTAIELKDHHLLLNGSTSITNNSFYGSAGNIVLNNTGVILQNNDFEGFSNPPGQSQFSAVKNPTAIDFTGSNIPLSIPPVYSFVPELKLLSNYFIDCGRALLSNKDAYVTLQQNRFNKDRNGNIHSGVQGATFYSGNNNYAPDRADSSKNLLISGNELHNMFYGVLLYNYTTNLLYNSNDIYAVPGVGSIGLLLDASNNLLQPPPNIFTRTDFINNNHYYNVHKGNELIAVPWVSHSLSNIYNVESYTPPPSECLNPPCPTIPGFGIKVLASNHLILIKTIIENDQVLPAAPDLDVSGIVVENCPRFNINCCRMENLPIGLHFTGNNTGYTYNSFTGSRFRDDYIGVALDNYAQIGFMPYKTKCIWEHVVQHSTASNPYGYSFYSMNHSNGNLSRQDYRQDYPIVNLGNDGSTFCSNILSSSAPASGTWKCGGSYPGGIPRLKKNKQPAAAKDSIGEWLKACKKRNASLPPNRARYELQWASLQYMNDSTLQKDSAAKAFGDSLSGLPFGKLIQAQRERKSDVLLKGMVAPHSFDKDVRFVIRMNFKQMQREPINKSEVERLRALARACPYEKGIAVIKARNVLGQRGEYNFYNLCEFERYTASALRKAGPEAAEAVKTARLYPNPAANSLNIRFEEEPQSGVVLVLYDLLGKKVQQYQLGTGKIQTVSLENTGDGIYFYRLLLEGEVILKGKQLIQH